MGTVKPGKKQGIIGQTIKRFVENYNQTSDERRHYLSTYNHPGELPEFVPRKASGESWAWGFFWGDKTSSAKETLRLEILSGREIKPTLQMFAEAHNACKTNDEQLATEEKMLRYICSLKPMISTLEAQTLFRVYGHLRDTTTIPPTLH